MSKDVCLRFIIKDKYDEDAATRALSADKYCAALWEIINECRRVTKYDADAKNAIEEIKSIANETGFGELWT